jgi:S-adenosylmethionine hydrolase
VYIGATAGSCKIVTPQKKEITSFRNAYAEGSEGEVFVLQGSTGYLEIVVRNGSAASTLGLAAGSVIGVVLNP